LMALIGCGGFLVVINHYVHQRIIHPPLSLDYYCDYYYVVIVVIIKSPIRSSHGLFRFLLRRANLRPQPTTTSKLLARFFLACVCCPPPFLFSLLLLIIITIYYRRIDRLAQPRKKNSSWSSARRKI
jgi:hypothetical protein